MVDNFDIKDMVVLFENGRRTKKDLKKLLEEKEKADLVEYIIIEAEGEDSEDGEEGAGLPY